MDYAISGPEIYPIAKDFCVHDFNPIFSDVHCAISSELEVENTANRKALKTPEFVLIEAISISGRKKASRRRTGSNALCAPLTKTFRSRQHLLC